MSCKRCEDIHLAQKEGKTQEACKCSCHDNMGTFVCTYNNANGTSTVTDGVNVGDFSLTGTNQSDWKSQESLKDRIDSF